MRFTDLLKDNPQIVLLEDKGVTKPLRVFSREYTKSGTLSKIYLQIDER